MGKKPNLAAAFEQAETDATRNADLLTRLQEQKRKSVLDSKAIQQPRPAHTPEIPRHFSPEPEIPKLEDELTVSLSTRVPKSLRQKLKRISLHREEQRQQPWGIQHIVTQALSEWLDKNQE